MKRNDAIDSVAGLLIIYMVFTHIMQIFGFADLKVYAILQNCLYFFMPWFFFKAGMFYRKDDNKVAIKKSIKRLIKPFIFYSLIGHLFYCIIYICKYGSISLITIFPVDALLKYGSIEGNLPLWFLLSLFICRIILNYLVNLGIKNYTIAILILIIICILHFVRIKYPFYISNSMTGLLFMCMGNMYVQNKKYTNSSLLLLTCAFIYICSLFYPSFVDMRSNTLIYGSYYLWLLYSVSGVILINGIGGNFILRKIRLNVVGYYSMEIYCIHWIVLILLKAFI